MSIDPIPPPLPTRGFAAFLFDMDGTILTSIVAAERVWTEWAIRSGIDPAALLPTIHGIRAVDTMRRIGVADPEAEAAELTRREIEDVAGIEAIAGAARFLASLPPDRWAVVTSAPRPLAAARLAAAGLTAPACMVTAEDVVHGKPAPDCFLRAASLLGVAIGDCLIFEDAPGGIAAAAASGATVMVMTATHTTPADVPHATMRDYEAVEAVVEGGLLGLRDARSR